MFTKPFRVKSQTPIKGSERKKVRAEFSKCFPNLTEEQLSLAVPNKEEMSSMKIETHSGEVILVHLLGKNPVFFHIRETLYPTVYLLWRIPSLLQYFTTWTPVVAKLAKGADLMLPGIIVDDALGLRAYGRLQKGTMVALNTNDNAAAVAVGKTALSSEDMYMAGKRGRGIEIVHCVGDYLFQHGTKENAPEMGPPSAPQATNKPTDEVKEDISEAQLEPAVESLSINETPAQEEVPDSVDQTEEELVEEIPTKSPQEQMDELLDHCFFKALKTSAKKVELPILTSNFFRVHMIPCVPAGLTLDVKKSSYKKLSKYLDCLKKESVIDVKELTKGVESITEINWAHPRIKSFEDKFGDSPVPEQPISSSTEKLFQPPVITELFNVNAAVMPLFSAFNYEKGSSMTSQQVRKVITEYVKNNNLQNDKQKNAIKLDATLREVLLTRDEVQQGGSAEISMTWDLVMQRCLSKMSPAFQLQVGDGKPVILKGKLEPIEISVASRAGNKKVTLISGLETFAINLEEFAHRCQVGVAASTSITTAAAKKGPVVLVQGSHVSYVGNMLLQDYGIPKKFIQGLELALKEKKGKR